MLQKNNSYYLAKKRKRVVAADASSQRMSAEESYGEYRMSENRELGRIELGRIGNRIIRG